MIYFVLLCGGKGTRVGLDQPKQYFLVNNKPVFMYSYDVFSSITDEKRIIIAAEPQYFDLIRKETKCKKEDLVVSGNSRQETVYNVLKHIRKINDEDIIVIHDSARIYVTEELVNSLINEIKNGHTSAIPYKNVNNAVFDTEKNKYISTSNLKIIETPQVFNFKKLKESYKNKDLKLYKDDGSLFLIKHKCLNFFYYPEINTKITTREDLKDAERRLSCK